MVKTVKEAEILWDVSFTGFWQEKNIYFGGLPAPSSVGTYTVTLKVCGKNTESEPA